MKHLIQKLIIVTTTLMTFNFALAGQVVSCNFDYMSGCEATSSALDFYGSEIAELTSLKANCNGKCADIDKEIANANACLQQVIQQHNVACTVGLDDSEEDASFLGNNIAFLEE